MNPKRYLDALLILLVVAFIGQSALAAVRTRVASRPSFAPGSPMVVGDTLPGVRGYLRSGTSTTIRLASDPGTVTVLYAFHPECAHCHKVAPDWAEHFSADSDSEAFVRRIAVTGDSTSAAYAYAVRFGWDVDVVSVRPLTAVDREYALISRTPWVFVFDSDGVLRFEGHGNALEEVAQVVAELSAVTDGFRGEMIG